MKVLIQERRLGRHVPQRSEGLLGSSNCGRAQVRARKGGGRLELRNVLSQCDRNKITRLACVRLPLLLLWFHEVLLLALQKFSQLSIRPLFAVFVKFLRLHNLESLAHEGWGFATKARSGSLSQFLDVQVVLRIVLDHSLPHWVKGDLGHIWDGLPLLSLAVR